MRKRILWLGLSFLLVAALVLASCAPAEEEEVVQSRFEGIEIVFFPGGMPGCTFATPVYNGAVAAAEDFGVDLKVYWSDWDSEKMVTQFKEAIAAKPDGIAIMGHPGVESLRPLIDEAIAMGIIVTTQNVDLPPIEEEYKTKGLGYVGQDLYASGVLVTKACLERFNIEPPGRGMVWGWLHQPVRGLRSQGPMDTLEAAGLEVDYIQVSPEAAMDPFLQVPVIAAYILANPDLKVIIADGGGMTVAMKNCLEAAGVGPDEIVVGGFDLSTATVDAIRTGYVDLVQDQQPYLQGYLPIVQICLTWYAGFSGLHIDTGTALVDKDNVDVIAALAEKGIR